MFGIFFLPEICVCTSGLIKQQDKLLFRRVKTLCTTTNIKIMQNENVIFLSTNVVDHEDLETKTLRVIIFLPKGVESFFFIFLFSFNYI